MPVERFGVAFINGFNLYPLGARSARNAADQMTDVDKVRGLAAGLSAVRRVTGDLGLLGLAEVGDESMAHDVFEAVAAGRYSPVWQGPPTGAAGAGQPGLMLGYNVDLFAVEEQVPGESLAAEERRFHWSAVRLRLKRTGRAARQFWAVVVHWPSDYGRGGTRAVWPRVLVGRALGEFWRNQARNSAPAMLLIGDFNCEPFDPALTGDAGGDARLVAVREHGRVLRTNTRLPYFYDPMWRLLGEGQAVRHAVAGVGGPRPPGTFASMDDRRSIAAAAAAPWRCLDHLLVNRWLLTGDPASLVEESVTIAEPTYGSSDHCAVGAAFEYAV